ncbi:MAG: hypothetical protein JNM94_17165 [Phycisphaerae bacterium]|nr:hypothetical protein [Phycisphaerae bacterium]
MRPRHEDIADLVRRADAALGADADIELAFEPLDDETLAEALAAPIGRTPRRGMRRRRLETIVCLRPRCPRCGGAAMEKYRSIADQGDGSSLWWMRCTGDRCGHRFKVVFE